MEDESFGRSSGLVEVGGDISVLQEPSFDPGEVLDELLAPIGLTSEQTGDRIDFVGEDPVLESPHRLGAASAISMMASAVGAAALWRIRTGRTQALSVDLRQSVHSLNPRSIGLPLLNGYPGPVDRSAPRPIQAEPYRTADSRWVCATGAYRHMLFDWLDLLRCSPDPRAVEAAFGTWASGDLEEAARVRGLALAVCHSSEEWSRREMGRVLLGTPVIDIEKIGDSDPEPMAAAERPLAGVRVLCNTHAISGPVVGRTMAEQGAEVLHISAVDQVEHEVVYIEANIGMRSAYVDLKTNEGNQRGHALAETADVFVENFTGGALDRLGFSPAELAAKRPGVIVVRVRCYGDRGPWADWGGHDQQGTAASVFAVGEGSVDEPRLPPTSMLNDYLTGYLGAAGATAALIRRAQEGGSYRVTVSLTRTAMWANVLGAVDKAAQPSGGSEPQIVEGTTPIGILRRLAPVISFSETPGRWSEPFLVPRGLNAPEWSS